MVSQSVLATNPWGAQDSVEAQRIDLWRLNLANVINYLNAMDEAKLSALRVNKNNLPQADFAQFYATQVIMPSHKTSAKEFIRSNRPVAFPGYVNPSDTVQVLFIVESDYEKSKILTLISLWQHLVRTGRTDDYRYKEGGLVLQNESDKPVYRFNIDIELLQGYGILDEVLDEETVDKFQLKPWARYSLIGAWPNSYQQSQINRSTNSSVHTQTVQLQVQEIIPQ